MVLSVYMHLQSRGEIVTSNLVGSKKRFACQDAKESDPCNSNGNSLLRIHGKSVAYRIEFDEWMK